MEELITKYEFKQVEAGCAPGSGQYGLQVEVSNDISPVFPYLNALMDRADYYHQSSILIWREEDRAYALRPYEIKIVRAEGIGDLLCARELVSEIVERVNSVWRDREHITPCFAEKTRPRPSVIDIIRLLPRTNCKQCGCSTCLAYAAGLREGKTELGYCPALLKPEYAENRRKLMAILSVD